MEKIRIKNLTEIENFKLDNREIFINKFIKKFPKANLQTLIQINKYYNKKNTNKITMDKHSIKTYMDYIQSYPLDQF